MIFDATVGTSTATSYLSVAAADAFAAVDVGPARDKWLDADTDIKERMLQRATSDIDTSLRAAGTAYASDQALLYPRAIDVTSGTPFIHRVIKRATWAQAKYLHVNIKVMDAAATRRAREMQSASEPNVSYTRDDGQPSLLCGEALAILEGAFSTGATITSVIVGTDYSYPRVGYAADLVP